ncbi:MAG: penicillin-binding transpeptidase domain-containing protein [Aggregatilineales bacterium]
MRYLEPFQGWRLTFFQGTIVAVFLIFSIRMYQWQVVNYDEAFAAAEENRLTEFPIPSDRGVVFDRYGTILAGNSPAYNVTIIPAALPDSLEETLEIYRRISSLVDVPPTRAIANASGSNVRSIEELVAEGEGIRPFNPVVVALDIPRRVALQIREESIEMPGVGIEVAAVREYPYGELLSHVIGYTGPIGPEEALELIDLGYNPNFDRIGYDGLEASLENVVAGERGSELREIDVAGEILSVLRREPSIPGENVRLTIDAELQAAAQQALQNRINFINADEGFIRTQTGVVIAMNPMTGEILALVSYPSYDNSRFAREIDADYYLQVLNDPLTPLVNHAVGSVYPPGSGWKLITAAGALEENVIDQYSTLYDPGDLLVANFYAENDRGADQRFVCWNREGHGALDMRGAIANSCNVYFYQVGGGSPGLSAERLRPEGLGIDDLFRYATALGIGSYTGVELYGEVATRMPDPDWKRRIAGENWSTGDTYNAAFGQGFLNVTPLQLINSVAGLVNNGTIYQPTLIREFLDGEGNVIEPFEPQVMRNVNLEGIPEDQPIRLHMLEDMIIQGPNSLTCYCEPSSDFYNANRCNPDSYINRVDINPAQFEEEWRDYTVFVPDTFNFAFTSICDSLRFDSNYTPAFLSTDTLQIVREGMRQTVVTGTAGGANLPYVEVAGKTGTAEYCDNIAYPLGLCVQGAWPSHAWFNAYAPYSDPEILIIGFIYNAGEGSRNALPVVVETMDAYFRLQAERENQPLPEVDFTQLTPNIFIPSNEPPPPGFEWQVPDFSNSVFQQNEQTEELPNDENP